MKTQGESLKLQTEHFYEFFKNITLEIKVPLKINFSQLDEESSDYWNMIEQFQKNVEVTRSKLSSFKSKELFDLEIVKKTQVSR